jgi:hypothetical protein
LLVPGRVPVRVVPHGDELRVALDPLLNLLDLPLLHVVVLLDVEVDERPVLLQAVDPVVAAGRREVVGGEDEGLGRGGAGRGVRSRKRSALKGMRRSLAKPHLQLLVGLQSFCDVPAAAILDVVPPEVQVHDVVVELEAVREVSGADRVDVVEAQI